MIMETTRLVDQCCCVFVKDQKLEQKTLDGDKALEASQWRMKKKQKNRRRRACGFIDNLFIQ
ncbi:hypothetical protein F2Q68_00017302 [Brassica cretica]|uniref:Uncharacterized protein n=2 Tax=Brassica cretica TaxID=69181 RepID=A0A8S9HN05_BRACR|nr:hypothetical protein F2Q68_00017302 [Brassica cretica]KAF3608224.1 hypothetical protein DY000_02050018 [Brassica cretica]